MLPLKDLAIKKALENNWQEAYSVNQQLLKDSPNDIDTLNRLAFSLVKLGRFEEAKKMYRKVVRIDKTNPIALKNLKKIDSMTKQSMKKYQLRDKGTHVHLNDLFIEEAGKTKMVELKNVTDKKTLSLLQPGDPVALTLKRSKIFIQSNNKYIGMLPDTVSMRLIPFVKSGSEYQAFIKSIDEKNVSVFIKETKKSGKFKNQLSFPSSGFIYQGLETKEQGAGEDES